MGVYKNVMELVGGTPLMELGNYKEKNQLDAAIFAKLEYFNPAGSVTTGCEKDLAGRLGKRPSA